MWIAPQQIKIDIGNVVQTDLRTEKRTQKLNNIQGVLFTISPLLNLTVPYVVVVPKCKVVSEYVCIILQKLGQVWNFRD